MESLNNVLQYPLNRQQVKGVKGVIEKHKYDHVILLEKIREYCSTISYITNIEILEVDNKPNLLIKTFDTLYQIKLFKIQKAKPLEMIG